MLREFLVPLLLLLLLGGALVTAIILLRQRERRRVVDSAAAVILAAPLAELRCVEAIGALRSVAAVAHAEDVEALWQSVGGPLERALESCPVANRGDLAQALEACARRAHAATALRLRRMRDRVLPA